ncbi:MAG: MBL fold metallo-hydrolase [Dehalococcoidia bacterium]
MPRRFAMQVAAAVLLALFVAGCDATVVPADPSPTPAVTASASTTPSPTTQPTPTPDRRPLTVHFIDVAQGDATLLQGPGFNILIDAGRHDRSDVVPYLQSTGITSIDLLVGTHGHADHIGQFPQVLETFPVSEVWLSGEIPLTRTFERAIDAITASDAGYHEPQAGEVFEFGSARVEVVNPDQLSGDAHKSSVSLRIIYGEVAFMFTGDAETETEHAMIERGHDLRSHVLQAGHHGSRTSSSTEFLEAVQPEVTIYSAAEGNSYGHPHPEAVIRMAEAGTEIYGTNGHGTILVITDGTTYEVHAERSFTVPVPTPMPTSSIAATGCSDGQVDINTASPEELTDIIHIGEDGAEQLVEIRPFETLDELLQISGIGPARLDDIRSEGLACIAD